FSSLTLVLILSNFLYSFLTALSTHLPLFFLLIIPQPPTSTLFPYTTLFRSIGSSNVKVSIFSSNRLDPLTLVNVQLVMLGDDCRSEEHTSELQSRGHLVCRLLLEKKKHPSNRIFYLWLPALSDL